MRRVVMFEPVFNGCDIQNTQQGALIGCLDKSYNLLSAMLDRHSQVLIHGYCCTYPDDGVSRDASNDTFLAFLGKFTDHLRHRGYDPSVIWCREQSGNMKPHWHFALLLDANRARFLENSYASRLWSKVINADDNRGCLHQADLGGMMRGMIVKRGDEVAFADAIYKMSYLAKLETKIGIPTGLRRYGGSLLR